MAWSLQINLSSATLSSFSSQYHVKATYPRSCSHRTVQTRRTLVPYPRQFAQRALPAETGMLNSSATSDDNMPESDLEQAAHMVRQLEQQAVEQHLLAQRLNKEGRFQEAQAAYAAMHALEDAASTLAAQVGCVACVLGEPGNSSGGQPSLCNMDPEELRPYQVLHPVRPWPVDHTDMVASDAAGTSTGNWRPEQQQLAERAICCVLGSALADAAAMGVHWVYDVNVLAELEEQQREWRRRQRQAAGSGGGGEVAVAGCGNGATGDSHWPEHSSIDLSDGFAEGESRHAFDFGLEFTNPPRSPFYAYASGRNSPYGEQTLALLRSLAAEGGLHCGQYAESFAAAFGRGSGFDGYLDVSTKGFLRNHGRGLPPPLSGADDAQANCIARLAPLVAAFAERPSPPPPAAPLLVPEVATDGQKAVVPTGTGLLQCVALATRVTQNTDAAVAWACCGAVVLEAILMGSTAESAVRHVVQDLQSPHGRLVPFCGPLASELVMHLTRVLDLRNMPVAEAVAVLGRNCHMPNALQTPLQVVLYVEQLIKRVRGNSAGRTNSSLDGEDTTSNSLSNYAPLPSGGASSRMASLPPAAYVWGVRLAVREGGCCASRAAYVGACLGALVAGGLDSGLEGRRKEGGLPKEWLELYPTALQVRGWAEALVGARTAAGRGEMGLEG